MNIVDNIIINQIWQNHKNILYYIILFIKSDTQFTGVEVVYFTKNGQYYTITSQTNDPLLINNNNIDSCDKINSHYFNFCCALGYKLRHLCYLYWLQSNKSIYEHHYGRIFKLSVKKKNIDEKCFELEKNFLNMGINDIHNYREIIDYINCYENIYCGIFSNDYSKEYGNKNVKFIKVSEV